MKLLSSFTVSGLFLAAGLAASTLLGSDAKRLDFMPADDAAKVDAQMTGAKILPGGIRFLETKAGTGPLIKKGDVVTALYVGRLVSGEIFNQKRSRFHSFRFEVGAQPRQIIRGWEHVLPLMQDGGTYQVGIPSEFGYREYGRPGQVPPHATLLFEIEIIGVERKDS